MTGQTHVRNSRYEVMTPDGWSSFAGIKRSSRNGLLTVRFDDGSHISATPEHRVKLTDGSFCFVRDLQRGDAVFGGKAVAVLDELAGDHDVFDLINVQKGHEYLTNDVVSHNCAFVRSFDDIWTGLYPTLTAGGAAILLSTPNGVGGQYYKIYTDAVAGLNNFHPNKLSWDVHPEHDEAWFKNETRGFSKKKVAQEYLCEFLGSGDTFLQLEDIEYLNGIVATPIEKTGENNGIWTWKHPIVGHNYMISADVARGDAHDYSALHVIDINEVEVVAEFMGKIPPDKFADVLFALGMRYNKAIVCPENNNVGYMTCSRLKKDLKYPNLYYEGSRNPYNQLYAPGDDDLPGFSTQQKSRTLVLAKLEELIRNKVIRVYSERFLNELNTFIWKGNKAQANKGHHDDLIMSLAIGLWVLDIQVGSNRDGSKMAEAMIAALTTNSHDLSHVHNSGHNVKPLVAPQIKGFNVYRPQPMEPNHANKFDDLLNMDWLLK